jgi:predicted nucleotidyltransferase
MKIAGIVCEYNPMHNGHLFHINRTRQNGATHILAVMSGNFVQRGETAVMDKFSRASCALKGGADLVIEIPSVYSLSSAEYYARGAVSIMNSLGCVEEISFGSECGDTALLLQTAEAVTSISPTDLEERMRKGTTYPSALTGLLKEKYGSAKMFLQELVDEMKIFGIEADYRIAHGVASKKIAAICERDNVSLIMMTKTGADMTNGDDLGSTSENVVLNSDCAVMLLPAEDSDEEDTFS